MALDNTPHAEVSVDVAGASNIIVAGLPSSLIFVHQLFLVVGGDTLLTFMDGATPFDGPLSMTAHGSIVLDHMVGPRYWFVTTPGNAFVITLAPAVQLSGRVYFSRRAV